MWQRTLLLWSVKEGKTIWIIQKRTTAPYTPTMSGHGAVELFLGLAFRWRWDPSTSGRRRSLHRPWRRSRAASSCHLPLIVRSNSPGRRALHAVTCGNHVLTRSCNHPVDSSDGLTTTRHGTTPRCDVDRPVRRGGEP